MNESAWPLNIDFTEALQHPQICFADEVLRRSQPRRGRNNRILMWSGNFATVYELVHREVNWAVRCFTRPPAPDARERYLAIGAHLMKHHPTCTVNFQYLERGILVKGVWYPILKMEWVDGLELDRYLAQHRGDRPLLQNLYRRLQNMQQELRDIGFAHGDLQHGNILVLADGRIKLVDYDGSWVPTLSGKRALETGHPHYQSPYRTLQDFDASLDDFAFEVLLLTIQLLLVKPELWEEFHEDGNNLLFRQLDFAQPHQSPLWQKIAPYSQPEIQTHRDRLLAWCRGDRRPWWNPLWDRFRTLQTQPPVWLPPATLAAASLVCLGGVTHLAQVIGRSQPPAPVVATAPAPPVPMTREALLTAYQRGQRDFRGVDLSGVALNSVALPGIDLRGARLQNSQFQSSDLRGARFNQSEASGILLRGAILDGADLQEANFTNGEFSEASLVGTRLNRSQLTQARFYGANLRQSEARQADLRRTDFGLANLQKADFSQADLTDANLLKTDLRGALLTGADLTQARLEASILVDADLRATDLRHARLIYANLQRADLSFATLNFTELSAANLQNANLQGITAGPLASVLDADFTGVRNLEPPLRLYLCANISGKALGTRRPSRDTLGCLG
ncbi:MAG: pentapeptide repeat-containing protein [Pseudanabaenaceae cyanobacterium]